MSFEASWFRYGLRAPGVRTFACERELTDDEYRLLRDKQREARRAHMEALEHLARVRAEELAREAPLRDAMNAAAEAEAERIVGAVEKLADAAASGLNEKEKAILARRLGRTHG